MRRPTPLPPPLDRTPFTIASADGLGVSKRRLRAKDLATPFRGIRMPQSHSGSRMATCRAYALRMRPYEAFSHATAAELWGLPLPWRLRADPRVHVVVWNGRQPSRAASVLGHRIADEPHLRRRFGLRVVAPADAWCQLAAELEERDLVVAGDRLLGLPKPLVTEAEIDAAVARHGARRGARRLRRARARLRPRSESPRETMLRLDLLAAGFPEPEPNGAVLLASGRSTRADLVFRAFKVIVEYDGQHHREDAEQWAKDVDRLNELATNGWIVIRVNKDTDLARITRLLRDALVSRGWSS
jgi:hypothetical protein